MGRRRDATGFGPGRRLAACFVAAGLVAALGCRGTGGRGKAGASSPPRRIAVIPMGTTHEFWKAVQAGALTAGRDKGVEIVWQGPLKEDDRSEQIEIVETLVSSGVDALVLSPIDDRALLRPVREAAAAGIPTVIFNSALTGNAHRAFVATDNFRGGVLAAERVAGILGGRGRIIMLRLKVGVEGTMKREDGFLSTVRARFPGLEVVSENQYAGSSTETAYQTAENLIARFGAVDAIFTPNESTTFGCLRALEDLGLAGKVKLVGFDSSDKLFEALRNGRIHGLVHQDPFRMGYEAVTTAVAVLDGAAFTPRVDTGVAMVTAESLERPEILRLVAPDLSILR